jgi:hypothetical protein
VRASWRCALRSMRGSGAEGKENVVRGTVVDTRRTLDRLVSASDRLLWSVGEIDLVDTERLEQPGQRMTHRARYNAFLDFPTASDAVAILNTYVVDVIPMPRATERTWWALSCLPATGRTRTQQRLATLNVYRMETLFLRHHDDAEGVGMTGVINVSRRALVAAAGPIERLSSASGLWSVHPTQYVSAEGDAVAVAFDGVNGWDAMVNELPGVDMAARRLVLDLMDRGRTNFAEQHCYDLADEVICPITDSGRPG